MSNYSVLKQDINNNIYENQTQQITGTVLNAILNEMTASLGAGYQFAGVAAVGMNPGDPDQRVFYLAGEGIYTSFGGIQVPAGKLGVLKWDNRWTLQTIDGLGGGGANLTGYVSVASTDDLPDEGQPTLGYLCGTNLYLYVGEGGDTKEGKYQDCGSFRGPQGDSVQDVEQTQTSLENGGVNKIKFTLSNGISCEFQVRNGTTSSGLFPTLAALQAAYPSPVVGQYAFVGAGFPADIYVCTTAGTWTDSGEDYDGDNVDLTDYATKAEVNQLEAKVDEEIYVGNGFPCDLEATRNLRPASNNTVVTGNNGYSYIVEVKSGKSYHIEVVVPSTSGNYLRGGFTQVYPANGVAMSGYWDNGTGKAILNKIAPFDGYLLMECAEDFTSIEVFEDNGGTIGRSAYDNKITQDVLVDTAVLTKGPTNLFDKSVGVVLNKYIIARRYETAGGYAITGPIYVRGGVQYKCPHDSAWLSSSNVYAVCTPSGEFYEGKQGTISGDFLLFTPEQDCYVCLNIGRTAWVDSFMLCAASNYPEQYVPYSKTIGDDYHLGAMQIQEVEDIVEPALETTQYFETEKSVNLFDKTNDLIKNGYYGGGAFHEDASYRVTHPIRVSAGVSYKAVFRANDLGSTNTGIAVVDNANNVLSFINGSVEGNYITITTSEDCYLSFNIGTYARLDEMMVCVESDYPESYVPFYEITKLVGVQVEDGGSPLIGKSVIFAGDSICYGAADTPQGAGYAKRIGEKYAMQWQNKAVSGGTIMDKDLIGSSFTISDTDFGTGADYIILEGGTNDADRIGSIIGGNTPQYYGSWNETDYLTTFGKSTFCDAVQRLIQRVVTNFPTARVGFIIAPKMGVSNSGFDAEHNNRRAYFQTIIEICRKWGVPVLNLWDNCTMNPRLASHYTEGQNYLYADGQHPTANGYDVITPIIEAWMETL